MQTHFKPRCGTKKCRKAASMFYLAKTIEIGPMKVYKFCNHHGIRTDFFNRWYSAFNSLEEAQIALILRP